MNGIRKTLCGFLFLLCLVTFGGEAPSLTAEHFRKFKTWERGGSFPLSFAAARNQVSARMQKQEFRLKHEIFLSGKQVLVCWEKDGRHVLYLFWKIDVDQTGYSMGRFDDAER